MCVMSCPSGPRRGYTNLTIYRIQAFVAVDTPNQALVAVDITEYTDTNDTTDTIDITDTYDITDTHDTIDPTCSKSNPVKLLQYTVDSARLYQGPWWDISTTSLTPTPPIYRHHTTPLTLVGYKHYLLPPSRPPDRCRTGYPTPGATGGTGAAGPLLEGGVPEGGRWRRSNQPWRGYASAREWTTTA